MRKLVRAGYTADNVGDESEVIPVATPTKTKAAMIAIETTNAANMAVTYLSHEGNCEIAFMRA